MDEVEQIFAPGGAIEAFEAAKKAGKCRFIGFTGHHDPQVHLAMLKKYDHYDTILMPLHAADPGYQSFEKNVLPVAVARGMGIQGMKSTANAKLLQAIALKDCLSYALSLPVHCVALGCTTIGQVEDDVRIAQEFTPLDEAQLDQIREQGGETERAATGRLEDQHRNRGRKHLPGWRIRLSVRLSESLQRLSGHCFLSAGRSGNEEDALLCRHRRCWLAFAAAQRMIHRT